MDQNNILNSFYQGLKLLIEFESGESKGSMQSSFFAINRIVGLLSDAADHGDVIAPFFLHYIAQKYPGFIDKELLPDLSTVPQHKSQAENWISSYKDFLSIKSKIEMHFKPVIQIVKSQKEANLKKRALEKRLKKLLIDIKNLSNANCSIAGLLAAKLYEKYDSLSPGSLTPLIIESYEKSAFFPNVLGMWEYYQYLIKTKGIDLNKAPQKKLDEELKILNNNDGDIRPIHEYYKNQNEGTIF